MIHWTTRFVAVPHWCGIYHELLKRSLENVIEPSPFVTSVRKVTETVNLQTSRSFLSCRRVMGGRTAPCLLAVALSSVLILIISRQLPCVCRVAPRGSSAACMVTAILEVSVGKVCARLVRLSWRDVLPFPADKERGGGREKRFGSLKSAWLPVSRYGGFPVARTSCDACRLQMVKDVLFLSDASSLFSTGDLRDGVIFTVRCIAESCVDLANKRNLYHMHLSLVPSASQLVSESIPPGGKCLNQYADIL